MYGTKENIEELRKKSSRLILCVEMDNWKKAEDFAEAIRQLTEQAPHEVKSTVLRLKMAVQKEDYEKTTAAYARLKEAIGLES
jgi:predicted negative regulator of RcsB-dependent stress response